MMMGREVDEDKGAGLAPVAWMLLMMMKLKMNKMASMTSTMSTTTKADVVEMGEGGNRTQSRR
jgi:hypothetical protein